MDNTLMTIIGIFLAATLMFLVPIMAITEKNDTIAQTTVQSAVSEFVDTVSTNGKIDPTSYEKMIAKLESTGNHFETTIEVQHLDENPGKKGDGQSVDAIGENLRYSTYTTEILSHMFSNEQDGTSYPLKKGDNIIVTARNTNKTLAQQLRSFLFKITGQGTYELSATSSAMVIKDGNNK